MSTELARDLYARVDDALRSVVVPGVAVGLLVEGEEHYAVRGVTSVDHPLPVDESTLFQTGSTAKTYTALAVVRLVEQGLLDLDAPVRRYVPELRMADQMVGDQLTLRHLLTHTGGHEGDLFDDFGGGDDCLSRFAAGMWVLPQLAPLGTFSYSNAGFSLAGRAVELATGLVFEHAMSQLVLEPLGHVSSVYGAAEAITHRVAVGHAVDGASATVSRPWALPRTANAAGGLASSVRDQLGYARFCLGDGVSSAGQRLVAPGALASMRAPMAVAGGGRAAHMGLAWLLQTTPGVIAHGGSANGQESAFVLLPDRGIAVTVLTNSSEGARLHGPLVRWVLREIAGVAVVRPVALPACPEELDDCVGTYASLLEDLVVARDDSGLTLELIPSATSRDVFPAVRASGPMPLEVFSDGRVLVNAGAMRGARGEFVRDQAGSLRWLRMLGRLHVR